MINDSPAVTFGELSVGEHFKLYPNSPELVKVSGVVYNAYNEREETYHYIGNDRQVERVNHG